MFLSPVDYEFAARIAVKHFNDADAWWTGGAPLWSLWPVGGRLKYRDHGGTWVGQQWRTVLFRPELNGDDDCLATTFLLRNTMVKSCSDKLRYVCEKRQPTS